jgi:hypothetical protein
VVQPDSVPDDRGGELKTVAWVGAHDAGRILITSLSELRHMVISQMRQLQKLPHLVRSTFHAKTTRYARAWWQLLWEG